MTRSSASAGPLNARLKIVMDTNAFVTLEPAAHRPESLLPIGAEFLKLASQAGHRVFLSRASLEDIAHDKNSSRREARRLLARKYEILDTITVPLAMRERLGIAPARHGPRTNDEIDLEVLAALWVNAADFLVTDDIGLTKRAARLDLEERVFTIAGAEVYLRGLVAQEPEPPPAVELVPTYSLDPADPILNSIRASYAGFDGWFRKACLEHRPALIIRAAPNDPLDGLAILKDSADGEYGLPGRSTKICTLKVADRALGNAYGELLLKSIFNHAKELATNNLFITTLPRQTRLLALLEDFGFYKVGTVQATGEVALAKDLAGLAGTELSALEAHRRFGPPFICNSAKLFIVPIVPEWHEMLFPDAPLGLPIYLGRHPFGNAIRKAYVCASPSNRLGPGDGLLFYRSHDLRGVLVVGVVEDTHRSQNPEEIIRFVGNRTVYRPEEIARMAGKARSLLAIRFRQDRVVSPPWSLETLQNEGVLRSAPQSIVELRKEAAEWIHERLAG